MVSNIVLENITFKIRNISPASVDRKFHKCAFKLMICFNAPEQSTDGDGIDIEIRV